MKLGRPNGKEQSLFTQGCESKFMPGHSTQAHKTKNKLLHRMQILRCCAVVTSSQLHVDRHCSLKLADC